ncbi:winged helix-turn-helix domain-containing protein [Candidatus Enterococcus ikei]|uniref:Response regulator transcription factor n=1 Tax=Candidatus Enterococcus ikei TaxID=2815326 RepID=A0ABS3GVF7_9ENTE|nr:winged helix-turn-helix domain-containing protein [Enterococcus sp. DIV0869a]MBO0438815.1 response regulator transcription factor [Enterococcus sp. DIV0869a]
MYNLGFVLLDEIDKEKYIESLNSDQLHVHPVNKKEVVENVENYNGTVINEHDAQNIGMICELIISLKKKSDTFIWVISERANKMNHIVYLQLGADGILDDECDTEECKLLITNSLDRYNRVYTKSDEHVNETKESSRLQLRPSNFSVVLNGEEINLTKLEFKTIEFLQTQQGVAVSYDEIYKNVWESDSNDKQYRVSNLIFHLRQKIEEDPAHPNHIKTVRSKGYKLTL